MSELEVVEQVTDSDDDDESDGDSLTDDDEPTEEGKSISEEHLVDQVLEQVGSVVQGDDDDEEEEERVYAVEPVQVEDKGTNTECVFQPDRSAPRRAFGLEGFHQRAILIKRSQTFSPSAAANRAEYICRLNRSDSDSSMPLYRRGPFQRNSVERRSLRWRTSSLAASAATLSSYGEVVATAAEVTQVSTTSKSSRQRKSHHAPLPPRTSVDLELDLLAQNKRLHELHEELAKLRELKKRLEDARYNGNQDLPSWLSEDDRLQALLEHVSTTI